MTSLIPTFAADQVAAGLSEYLATSFSLAEKNTAQQLRDFLLSPKEGMFNGPYVRTRLPYAPAEDWEGTLGWLPSWFKPYWHQAEAFKRLASQVDGVEHRPEPTLVVTGTGSGKTEAFLYPILDHCRRVKDISGEGMKALILYPMNALAADQERRLADLITSNPELSGVTAGIYTGEYAAGGRTQVSEHGLIDDRHAMRDNPPDILLTNYKMLDQLLLRENDRPLWEKSARTLQYLALDEFHTYDAAQGTDVAMLLRRLGLMLKKYQGEGFLTEEEARRPLGRVTPVATSATLGGESSASPGEEDASGDGESLSGVSRETDRSGDSSGGAPGGFAGGDILEFAHTVFGETFPSDAVVRETTLSVDEWRDIVPGLVGVPRADATGKPDRDAIGEIVESVQARLAGGASRADETYSAVVHAELCARVFGCAESVPEAIAAMAENDLVQRILQEASQPIPLFDGETMPDKSPVYPLVARIFGKRAVEQDSDNVYAEFLSYVLAEMAYVRSEFGRDHGWDAKKIPGVETHLWVRELSRIDRSVGATSGAHFRWSDDGAQVVSDGLRDASRGAGLGVDDGQRAGAAEGPDAVGAEPQAWLPACYCRHCGRSGWMIALQPGDDGLVTEPGQIRRLSVSDPVRVRPLIDATSEVVADDDADADARRRVRWLNLDDGVIQSDEPDEKLRNEGPVAPIITFPADDEHLEEAAEEQRCPSCEEDDGIRFLGSSVATLLSVALSNLFGLDDLDAQEKKTLVFADSVQDAAHRAGFVQSRARAFTLRARIHEAVRGHDEDVILLDQIAAAMIQRAEGAGTAGERARQLYELLPPELTQNYNYRRVWDGPQNGDEYRRARRQLERRLNFDLALQFGDRVDLPRSLVSTGTLTVSVDVTDRELTAATRDVVGLADDRALLAWARGVLEYMRVAGGIKHEWLQSYMKRDCAPGALRRRETRSWGVPYFPRGGAPKFPRSGPALKKRSFNKERYGAQPTTSPQGWYARWTARVIGNHAGTAHSAANLVTALFDRLAKAGIVGSMPTQTAGTVYYLEPERIVVTEERDPHILECTVCGFRLGVGKHARTHLIGARCFTADCTGQFQSLPVDDNYYQDLYRSHGSRTIVSAEHTGLLDAEYRKRIEDQFKLPVTKQSPDAPNVLVATPTLEMGIDIGDLSTVMLSSMPPTVANYVQRVGRAGRLSGNSLIVALVRGRGRALTKLEHPLETIAGSVTPPAAFLSARDILHRQFVAHLFDSHEVAAQLPQLRSARDVFTNKAPAAVDVLLEILSGDVSAELDRFIATLAGYTTDDVVEELRHWVTSEDGLRRQLTESRQRWSRETSEVQNRVFELEQRSNELEGKVQALKDADDDVKHQLRHTKVALGFAQKQKRNLLNEYWINALERYGLLPNFTLLDAAVEFHLSVSSFNEELQQYETEPYEYTRGVSSALTELAPGNTFYVRGVGATIDQIELEKDAGNVGQWRVCPACSYSEDALADSAAAGAGSGAGLRACPRCNSPAFADRAQVIDVVEMAKVYASVDRSQSAIGDRHDQRRSTRFQVQLSYSVPEGAGSKGWFLENTGFGMQYLPHVDMRWMNLGRLGGGSKKQFGGEEIDAPLFRVCRHCGHLDSEAGENKWQDHTAWCPQRNALEEDSINVALGRTLDTQGVLVHLPASLVVMDSSTLPSLIAALRLGFKQYLGGNPDHLDIAAVKAVSDGHPVDMLLIHDTVPGGTGYLAHFVDAHQIRNMLEMAYRHLENCRCVDEDREACPACLLPFARGLQAPNIARAAAAIALKKILFDELHVAGESEIAESSWEGKLTATAPQLSLGSELEVRFLTLFRGALEDRGATVTERRDSSLAHWSIRLPGTKHRWTLKEQVDYRFTRPDFVLSTDDPSVRDFAIYTDGAAYHRSNVNNRVKGDFEKRNRLYDEYGLIPWSVTSSDLDRFQALHSKNEVEPPSWVEENLKSWLTAKLGISRESLRLPETDPVTVLLAIMKNPGGSGETEQQKLWRNLSEGVFFQAAISSQQAGGTEPQLVKPGFSHVDVAYAPQEYSLTLHIAEPGRPDSVRDEVDPVAWQLFLGLSNYAYLHPKKANVQVRVGAASGGAAGAHAEVPRVGGSPVDDSHVGDSSVGGSVGAGSRDEARLPEGKTPVAESSMETLAGQSSAVEPSATDSPWAEFYEEFEGDEEVVAAFRALEAAGMSVPDPDTLGEQIGEELAIVAWPEEKVALVYPDDEDVTGFSSIREAGFTPLPADFTTVTEKVRKAFTGDGGAH